jgi:hypothetical protein
MGGQIGRSEPSRTVSRLISAAAKVGNALRLRSA